MVLTYHSPEPFELESGRILQGIDIAYHTFGTPNAERSNVIWVCHALTANSDVADWWPHTVEKGCFLDPDRYYIVCANVLGSHYGSTGPLSINPESGAPYYNDFPPITVRDMVKAHRLLARHLGIDHVEMLIGSSLGGFQSMEWAIADPTFPRRLALIATSAYTTPWAAAFNESQRMAIASDATYGQPCPEAGAAGMAAARSMALLSYRGPAAYNLTQADNPCTTSSAETLFARRVHTYQQHQGEKLCKRFNAYSYERLSRAVDSHDVGRGRQSRESALASIRARTLVIGITSDILFTINDARYLADHIPTTEFRTIKSDFGHDGFLVEHAKLNSILLKFLDKK